MHIESQRSNEQLCELIQQGQEALLFQLWEKNERFIRSLAKGYIRRFPEHKHDLIDDCVQESYLWFSAIVSNYRPERGSFLNYLKVALKNVFRSVMFSGRGRAERDPLNHCFSLDAVSETDEGEMSVQIPDKHSQDAYEEIANADFRRTQNAFIRACIQLSSNETGKAILTEMLESNCGYREAINNLYGPLDEQLIIRLRRRKDLSVTEIRRSHRTKALRKKYGLEDAADRSGLRGYTFSRYKANSYTSEVERIVINSLK